MVVVGGQLGLSFSRATAFAPFPLSALRGLLPPAPHSHFVRATCIDFQFVSRGCGSSVTRPRETLGGVLVSDGLEE